MKFKATRKMIMNNYHKVIEISYCGVQHLLYHKSPIAYTCGVYGWNSDIYDLGNGVAIVTGYRPFGNIHPNYSIVNAYDRIARGVIETTPYELREKALSKLLNEFIEEVLK